MKKVTDFCRLMISFLIHLSILSLSMHCLQLHGKAHWFLHLSDCWSMVEKFWMVPNMSSICQISYHACFGSGADYTREPHGGALYWHISSVLQNYCALFQHYWLDLFSAKWIHFCIKLRCALSLPKFDISSNCFHFPEPRDLTEICCWQCSVWVVIQIA